LLKLGDAASGARLHWQFFVGGVQRDPARKANCSKLP